MAAAACCTVALAAGGCGGSAGEGSVAGGDPAGGGAAEGGDRAGEAAAFGDPARWFGGRRPALAFAPLVHHHSSESTFPISAPRFVERSTLKWKDGRCRTLTTIATGSVAESKTPGDVPRLRAARLGGHGGAAPYRRRALRRDCERRGGRAYASTERTRPFDPGRRAAGLRPDGGFYLDILSDSLDGDPRFERPGGQRVLAGVPTYYERTPARVGGRAGVRLAYWLLYGRTEHVGLDGERAVAHEGGWERVDVLLRRGRRGLRPVALELWQRGEREREPWRRVEVVGSGGAGEGRGAAAGTHPVVYSARRSHVPYTRAGRHAVRARIDGRVASLRDDTAACADCAQLRAWQRLRPLRGEPWRDFGGGWGYAYRTDDSSGPPGP